MRTAHLEVVCVSVSVATSKCWSPVWGNLPQQVWTGLQSSQLDVTSSGGVPRFHVQRGRCTLLDLSWWGALPCDFSHEIFDVTDRCPAKHYLPQLCLRAVKIWPRQNPTRSTKNTLPVLSFWLSRHYNGCYHKHSTQWWYNDSVQCNIDHESIISTRIYLVKEMEIHE